MSLFVPTASAQPGFIACFELRGRYVVGIVDAINDGGAVVCWDDFRLTIPRGSFLWLRPGPKFGPSAGAMVGRSFATEEAFELAAREHEAR